MIVLQYNTKLEKKNIKIAEARSREAKYFQRVIKNYRTQLEADVISTLGHPQMLESSAVNLL